MRCKRKVKWYASKSQLCKVCQGQDELSTPHLFKTQIYFQDFSLTFRRFHWKNSIRTNLVVMWEVRDEWTTFIGTRDILCVFWCLPTKYHSSYYGQKSVYLNFPVETHKVCMTKTPLAYRLAMSSFFSINEQLKLNQIWSYWFQNQ